jgi:hypothetical protein
MTILSRGPNSPQYNTNYHEVKQALLDYKERRNTGNGDPKAIEGK